MLDWLHPKKSLLASGLLKGAVDNHSHILWGVDDGVRTREESLAILSFLEQQGVSQVWLTPHTMEDVPNTTEGLRARFAELQAAYKGPILLHLASEYMMDPLFARRLEARDLLTHGRDRVLVETSTWSPPLDFWELIDTLFSYGYTPLLAHPERYRYMQMEDYERLRTLGVLFQMNIPSILGIYGSDVQAKARDFLARGWYCMTGSDCHRLRSIHDSYGRSVLSRTVLSRMESLMGSYD